MAEDIVARYKVYTDEFGKASAEIKKQCGIVERTVGDASQKASKSFDGIGTSLKNVGEGIAGALSVQLIAQFVKATTEAYAAVEKGEKQLLNALKGRQDINERLIKQQERLKKSLAIDDDITRQAQTFLAIQGRTAEQIEKTIEAAVQLASVTGDTLQGAVEKLDATFEGNIERLGKLDAGFKSLTKEQLANGAAIDLVSKKYKGFAEGSIDTTATRLERVKIFFEDIREGIGSGFAAIIAQLGVAGDLIDAFKEKVFGIAPKPEETKDTWQDYFDNVEQQIQQASRQTFDNVAGQLIKNAENSLAAAEASLQSIKDRLKIATDPAEIRALNQAAAIQEKKNIAGEKARLQRVIQTIEAERERKKEIFQEQADDEQKIADEAAKRRKAFEEKYRKELLAFDENFLQERVAALIEDLNKRNLAEKEYSVERIKIELFELEERKKNLEQYGEDVGAILKQIADKQKQLADAIDKASGTTNRQNAPSLLSRFGLTIEDDELKKAIKNMQDYRDFMKDSFLDIVDAGFAFSEAMFANEENDIRNRLELRQQEAEKEEEELTARRDQGIIGQAEYEKKLAAIKDRREQHEKTLNEKIRKEQRKQALFNKLQTVFNIGLTTAEAIMRAQLLMPNLALVASATLFAKIAGAIQLAAALALNPPTAHKGERLVKRKGQSDYGLKPDETLRTLQVGERVVDRHKNRKHWGLLEAMDDGRLEKHIEEVYIAPRLKAVAQKIQQQKQKSFADNLVNSLALHSAAAGDNSELIEFLQRRKLRVEVTNMPGDSLSNPYRRT